MAGSGASPDRSTVAVLGGTGFIGAGLTRFLVEHGHDVLAVARRPPRDQAGRRFRAMDLSSAGAEEVAALLRTESVDAVVNAAGGMWGLTDEELVGANLDLVRRLIDAVAILPRRPRLVQLGSVHEYGLVPVGRSIDEDTPPLPVTRYGAVKLRCTEAVTDAAASGRVDALTLRLGNVVGAGQPRASLLGEVAERLRLADREGRTALLDLGPLGSRRDFVGLGDTCRAILAALTAPLDGTTVINVGSGAASTARDMVRLLIEVSAVPAELNEAHPQADPEPTWQQLGIDRAREVLGWSPEQGVRDDMRALWDAADRARSARSA